MTISRSPPPLGSHIYLVGHPNPVMPSGRPQHLKITSTHLTPCLRAESAQRCQSYPALLSGRITSVAPILTFELTTSFCRNQNGVCMCVCVCARACNSSVSTITIPPFEPPCWETAPAEQQVPLSQQPVAERRQRSLAAGAGDSKPGPSSSKRIGVLLPIGMPV